MKAIGNRIRRLQHQLCPEVGQPQRLWFLIQAGCELALDLDRCTEILDECGFLPTGRFGVVNFFGVPHDMNAKVLEQYLRRNGAETCGFGENQEHIQLGAAVRPGNPGLPAQAQMIAGERR
jgi:hypothetical protein